jgi:SAM-dependent methyltransferase
LICPEFFAPQVIVVNYGIELMSMTSVNNFFLNPIDVRRDVRKQVINTFSRLTPAAKVYDIGCGDRPFEAAILRHGCTYIGVDIEQGFYSDKFIDLVGSAYHVPVKDQVADVVLLIQVIEHLERPHDAFIEARRILKTGGIMLVSFPFLYPVHAAPHDYMRYTRFYLSMLANKTDFEILEQKEISGFWYSVGVNFGIYLQALDRGLLKKIGLIRIAIALVQWVAFTLHQIEGWALDVIGKRKDVRSNWPVNYFFILKKLPGSVENTNRENTNVSINQEV